MKYTQKAKEIDAFTFPAAINVQQQENQGDFISVPFGDYLLFVEDKLIVMSKKEFHAKHDAVSSELTETRQSKPRSTKQKTDKASKRGLKTSVLEQ